MDHDTIAAIATPIGCSGIGIVRISGEKSISIAKKLFRPQGTQHTDDPFPDDYIISHHLTYGHIIEEGHKGIVDEVLLAVMKAPRSYTREDVVEIQSHSGSVVLSKLLSLVIEAGARLAEPGEFTKRAFLNGRIDLSQAEAISDMITAKTEVGLKLAGSHLYGALKDAVMEFIDEITKALVEIEARIEFPEDIEAEDHLRERMAYKITNNVIKPIEALIRHYDNGHILRDGIRLDIVGRPNVGKSSLLNRLVQREKAIVTHIPGTTRDLIEDYFSIDGIPILITDTAGIQVTDDPVEIIGIRKTKENIQRSDLVLWVVDAERGFREEDQLVFSQIKRRNMLLVLNKKDLLSDIDVVEIPFEFRKVPHILISAKYGQGIDKLKEMLKRICLGEVDIEPGRTLVPNLRQKTALKEALSRSLSAVEAIQRQMTDELIALDLSSAKAALGSITGGNVSDDILDDIFNNFCIGK